MSINRIFLIFLFSCLYFSLVCQPIKIRFEGVVSGENGNIAGVNIKIELQNKPYESTNTDNGGGGCSC